MKSKKVFLILIIFIVICILIALVKIINLYVLTNLIDDSKCIEYHMKRLDDIEYTITINDEGNISFDGYDMVVQNQINTEEFYNLRDIIKKNTAKNNLFVLHSVEFFDKQILGLKSIFGFTTIDDVQYFDNQYGSYEKIILIAKDNKRYEIEKFNKKDYFGISNKVFQMCEPVFDSIIDSIENIRYEYYYHDSIYDYIANIDGEGNVTIKSLYADAIRQDKINSEKLNDLKRIIKNNYRIFLQEDIGSSDCYASYSFKTTEGKEFIISGSKLGNDEISDKIRKLLFNDVLEWRQFIFKDSNP